MKVYFLDDEVFDEKTQAYSLFQYIQEELPAKVRKEFNETIDIIANIEYFEKFNPKKHDPLLDELIKKKENIPFLLMDQFRKAPIGDSLAKELRKHLALGLVGKESDWIGKRLRIVYISGQTKEMALLDFMGDPVYDKSDLIKKQNNFYEKTEKFDEFLEALIQQIKISRALWNMAEDISEDPYPDLVGENTDLLQIKKDIQKIIGPTGGTAMILGPSGTGKESIAKMIHKHSRRSGSRFIAENIASIATEGNFLYTELFGRVKGATGEDGCEETQGLFQRASGGTLFLDEIGDAPLQVQSALLRAIQEQKVRKLGGYEEDTVDVRIIAATNKPLLRWIEEDKIANKAPRFREDLYYRLCRHVIILKELKDHKEDIGYLVYCFAQRWKEERDLLNLRAKAWEKVLENDIFKKFFKNEQDKEEEKKHKKLWEKAQKKLCSFGKEKLVIDLPEESDSTEKLTLDPDEMQKGIPKSEIPTILPEHIAKFCQYAWPGNTRELQMVVYRCLDYTAGKKAAEFDITPLQEYIKWSEEECRKCLISQSVKNFASNIHPLPAEPSQEKLLDKPLLEWLRDIYQQELAKYDITTGSDDSDTFHGKFLKAIYKEIEGGKMSWKEMFFNPKGKKDIEYIWRIIFDAIYYKNVNKKDIIRTLRSKICKMREFLKEGMKQEDQKKMDDLLKNKEK